MEMAFLAFGIMGILFIGLSIPLIKQKVKINSWYGFRLPQTMKDKSIWYKTNRKGGIYFLYLGIVITILSVIFYLQNLIPTLYSIIFLSVVTWISVVGLVIKSSLLANKIAKDKKEQVISNS